MAQAPEVVIVGADGTEHIFPPGFDPQRAASIVRSGAAPSGGSSLDALTGLSKATSIKGPMSAIDQLLSYLPTLGGATGGIIGGAGGSAFGMGFGGVPGAVGGAAFGGATGEAMRQNARRILGGTRDVPASATEATKDIGNEAALQAIYELGGQGATRGLSKGAESVYRGYLKPSLAKQSVGKADQIVKTALDEALPVTKAGTNQANRVMGELRQQVDSILADTPGEIDLHRIAGRVRAFAKAKYFKAGKPTADYEAALKVADELDAHPSIMRPGPPVTREVTSPIVDASGRPMTTTETVPGPRVAQTKVSPTQANQVKRGLDESIGDANFGVDRGATKTTQKFARRYVRQDIEALAPEVGALNQREGRLIDTAKALARAVGRESNKSPLIGVNTLASAAIGGERYRETGDPYASAALALGTRLALTPEVMTRIAIVASRLGKMPGAVPANIARIAVQAVQETADEP